MGYKNAVDILPSELILQIQKYIDGESVYIPRIAGTKRNWGENTNTRYALDLRNTDICEKYKNGVRVQQLAEEYHISTQGIYKIILKSKT